MLAGVTVAPVESPAVDRVADEFDRLPGRITTGAGHLLGDLLEPWITSKQGRIWIFRQQCRNVEDRVQRWASDEVENVRFAVVAEASFIDLELDFPLPTALNLQVYSAEGSLEDAPVAETEISAPNPTARWQPDIPPGDYVLVISASWSEPQGDSALLYGITMP